MNSLHGKVCLVTGGGGSIGRQAAKALLERGASVQLIDKDPALLEAARDALAEHAKRLDYRVADVADAGHTREYVQHTLSRWGAIDVLFCNAGINGAIRPIHEYPEDVFDAVMAVNVRGPFLAMKHALPVMKRGGSIIITSSVVGVTADPGICAYAASKHAVIGLMRVAAKEAAPRGIRVNVLAPGPIANDFQADVERRLSEVVGRDAREMLDEMIPLGRHGLPEEIARMVVFLASDDSSFSTGSVFMADGGMHI